MQELKYSLVCLRRIVCSGSDACALEGREVSHSHMVERKGKAGSFLGCKSYPVCKNTEIIIDENSIKCVEHLKDLGFKVSVVWSSKRGEKLPDVLHWLEVDYILSFRSQSILPESLLKIPKFYSINFHPGPPEYPGTGCFNFAIYEFYDWHYHIRFR